MNQNPRNGENDNEQNVHGLRKITYWEKYGVKRFSYPGKRRYTPLVYQSEDGGIIISNDVFGLTIRQFERSYKACLDRRKAQEQYIINLRYPDKTSDEYMEYLQESTDYNKDYVTWSGNNLKERNLYKHLVNTAGSEIDIRKRQQLFITHEMIQNKIMLNSKITAITSGSLAEGLDLQGSDIDLMYVINDVDVIRDVQNPKYPVKCTTLVMENYNDYPGFTRLRLIAVGKKESYYTPPACFETTRKGLYLSVNKFVTHINMGLPNHLLSSHGPCLADQDRLVDLAFCLRSKYLPYNVIAWATRHRMQWPPNSIVDRIEKTGCLLVPIGPRILPDCNVLWRLSFSVAEKLLVHSLNYTQMLCYCLLKLTLKHIVNTNKGAEGLLCSYFLKTSLFWVSEEIDIETFQFSKLYSCYSHCLSKLILWVNNCYCPNYFIPEQNMFLGKISQDNNKILMHALDRIKSGGITELIHSLSQHDNVQHGLLRTQSESAFVILDFLFYRTSELNFANMFNLYDCLQCWKTMKFIEYKLESKLSTYIVDVCKYHQAEISQFAAQLLPTRTETIERYYIHKRYHRHLQDDIKTDAVSGWLLYASFYYVTGQFNVTLKLTEYIMSRCLPCMVLKGCQNYDQRDINYYKKHVHSTMTLQDKMRITLVSTVKYSRQSLVMPNELQLEVKYKSLVIPPIFMSHCLRFLCYHHLGDMLCREQALRDMFFTVKEGNIISVNTVSNSLTILGVCFEISDAKDTAYQCYNEALQCDGFICFTAEERRLKLLTDIQYNK